MILSTVKLADFDHFVHLKHCNFHLVILDLFFNCV